MVFRHVCDGRPFLTLLDDRDLRCLDVERYELARASLRILRADRYFTTPTGASAGTVHLATQNVRSGCFSFWRSRIGISIVLPP